MTSTAYLLLNASLKKVSPEERYLVRLKRGRPIVDEFTKCFFADGRLEIDNNCAERSIKPFVIGRKNWLFVNAQRGAKAIATIYSIIETAKENGLNPFAYLQYLFEQLPNIDLNDQCALDKLLPCSKSLLPKCRKYSEDNKEHENHPRCCFK